MPRPPRDDAATAELAKSIIATSTCVDEVRAAQAFLLPLMGLSLEQTAEVVGKDRFWVSRTRNRFLRGEPTNRVHGGRRNALLSPEQEHAIVRDALVEFGRPICRTARSDEGEVRRLVRKALLALLKRSVNESTVTELLDRYVSKIVPGAKWSDCRLEHSALARLADLELRLPGFRARADELRARRATPVIDA